MGARQYRFIHAQEGYGKAILKSHQLDDADTMILFSHSGINAVIMDIAMECKARGIGLIGVTSLPHSSATPSRHSSGKRLFEVADVVIDTGIPLADAAIRIDGLEAPVGPARPASPSRLPTPSSRRRRKSWCSRASRPASW